MFESGRTASQACDPSFWCWVTSLFSGLDLVDLATIAVPIIALGGLLLAWFSIMTSWRISKLQSGSQMYQHLLEDKRAMNGYDVLLRAVEDDVDLVGLYKSGEYYDYERFTEIIYFMDRLEQIGTSVRKGLIDIRGVDELIEKTLLQTLHASWPIIEYARSTDTGIRGQTYSSIEWLFTHITGYQTTGEYIAAEMRDFKL